MAKAAEGFFYIDETCIGCGACEHACPRNVDAISRLEEDFLGRFVIDPETCINCNICPPLCPVLCIHDARAEGIVAGDGGYRMIAELQAWARQMS
jgi:formate hydrogenlyase subunit 6/NADH:ubiquinone oxidoreductase subunit I